MLDDEAPLDLKVEPLRARLELDDLPELSVEGVAAEQDVERLGVLVRDEVFGADGEIADHESKKSLALFQEHHARVRPRPRRSPRRPSRLRCRPARRRRRARRGDIGRCRAC